MKLYLTEYRASYRVPNALVLPAQPWSLFRGVLGRALHQVSCAHPAACVSHCTQPQNCDYIDLFESLAPRTPVATRLTVARSAVKPLVLLIEPKRRITAGATLEFGVRVFGNRSAGQHARIQSALSSLSRLPLGRQQAAIEFVDLRSCGPPNRIVEPAVSPSSADTLKVHFTTPAWLEHRGHLANQLDFRTLYRAVYRRLTHLCTAYGDYGAQDDERFHQLDSRANTVRVRNHSVRALRWERHAQIRGQHHPMRGLTGHVTYCADDLRGYVPLFELARITHIGKATSFGLGGLRVLHGS